MFRYRVPDLSGGYRKKSAGKEKATVDAGMS